MELQLNEYFDKPFQLSNLSGEAVDADALPTFRIYAEGADTPIETGNAAKRDDAGTVGFYVVRTQLTAAKGYTLGTIYEVRVAAIVGGLTGAKVLGQFLVVSGDVFRQGDQVGLTAQQARDAMKLAPTAGDPAIGSLDKQVDDIQAETATIGVAATIVPSPMPADGVLELVKGDDYSVATGDPVEITDGGTWPDLSGGSFMLTIRNKRTRAVEVQVSGSLVGSSPQVLRFAVPHAQSASLTVGKYSGNYDIQATLSGGAIKTLSRGVVHVSDEATS